MTEAAGDGQASGGSTGRVARGPSLEREAAMLEIARALNAALTLETALERVLELTSRALDADAVSIFVHPGEDPDDELEVSFVRRGGRLEQGVVSTHLGLSGHVMATGEAVRVDDVLQEPRFRGKLDTEFGTRTRALVALPMRRGERLSGLVEALREVPRGFDEDEFAFLRAVADELAVAVENARLIERLQWELEVRELLLDAARKVGSSLDTGEILDHLLTILERMVPHDAGGIYLLDPGSGGMVKVRHHGYPAGTEDVLLERPGTGLTGWAARHRQSLNVGHVADDPRYLEARPASRSEVVVPIFWRDEVIGVITLESDREDAFSDRQVALLEMITGQVASAITNARLAEERVERARIDHELALSREIQKALFPAGPLCADDLDALGVNVPSSAVGGDYYDHFRECPRHAVLVVADVSGHGLSAALLMSAVRSAVHLRSGTHPDPAALATQLNHLLHESTPANQFVAAVLAVVDLADGVLRYCNAGHVPPVWIHAGESRTLEGGGAVLGAFGDTEYEALEVKLAAGDLLAFYTDGLTEMTDPDDEEFGRDRLASELRDLRERPLAAIMETVRCSARRHRAGAVRRDDVTLMLARWKGPAALPEPPPRGDPDL